MPCAAGRRWAVPDDTPGPPRFTNHQCRGVCGQYLHGNCGVVDPRGTSEMHRICHTCATSRESETSGAGQSSGAAAPPPPYGGVAEHFCELEDTAEKCGMSEVSYHLRKAKQAWMSAFGERETKQTCMRLYGDIVRLTGRKECVCFLHLRRFVARAMFS